MFDRLEISVVSPGPRFGCIVQWSDWQVPYAEPAPPEFHFDADQYDAELDRVDTRAGRSGIS
ncbi:hypothetical protein ACFCZR_11985 [Streptomyces rubiginosohelvolus]|uniref:hypothetical protein n=1 Tax=Streptomyces rubiginosohelvolus TaxID=67362 RepID=UPI0035D842F9